MNTWQSNFKKWLKENYKNHLTDRSIEHYAGAIKNIFSWVSMDISDITSKKTYMEFEHVVFNNATFISRNSAGRNMYSIALKHFHEFITADLLDDTAIYPEEITSSDFVEGGKKQITINAYERNLAARKQCIQYYGAKCIICNFDFCETYGDDFDGIIHVHHLKPLSDISKKYVVDPIKDLVPVCPNCHLIIHSKTNGVYTIEEVKQLIARNKHNDIDT